MSHCGNVHVDRTLGEFWEKEFCRLAAREGFSVTRHQSGHEKAAVAFRLVQGRFEHLTLPDVELWGRPNQQHEVKHKAPTGGRMFGLEKYRFRTLLELARMTNDGVYYTIHNHQLSGGRDSTVNDIDHWVTANVLDLNGRWKLESVSPSYVNGRKVSTGIYYWPQGLFIPLAEHFQGRGPRPGGQQIIPTLSERMRQLKVAA